MWVSKTAIVSYFIFDELATEASTNVELGQIFSNV